MHKARGDIVLTQKQLYRAGRIVTRAGLGIDPNQTFADPEKADELMVSALLANAYTSPPFDAAVFRKEFSTAEAGKVFNALFGGSTQSGDVSAVDNFGLGLELSSAKKPKEFDPAPGAFFATIREELLRSGGELRLYSFYEKYTNAPYGLLEDMVTLYLLAFVRFAQPHCYLTVKPEMGLKLKSGKAPLDNRIGPTDVIQVAWTRGRLHRALDRLVQAVCPSWNDLEEFEHALTEQFERDKGQFSMAVEQVKALDELDRLYAQPLLDALAYLAILEGIPQASPLTTDRDLVQTRFAFATFCKQPSQASAVLKVFEEFTHKYRSRWQDSRAEPERRAHVS